MNMKRFVYTLIGVVLIAFGLGALSLRYNDNFSFKNTMWNNSNNINFSNDILEIKGDSKVKIGLGGLEVKDGDDYVSIGLDGINVTDGDDKVSVGWDGISVKEGDESKINIEKWNLFKGNWSLFGSRKDLKTVTLDEEKLVALDDIKEIYVSSSFIDVKVSSSDRDDVKINYYGTMKTNVVPELQVEKTLDTLKISLIDDKVYNYTVVDSDVILEILIPRTYNENLNIEGSSSDIVVNDIELEILNTLSSSGNIAVENIYGDELSITSSSGNIDASKLEGNKLNLTSSSGEIEIEDSKGIMILNSSSGDIKLGNRYNDKDIKINTSSGNISIGFGANSSYEINGKSSSGDFETLFPINRKEYNDDDNIFRGTIGSGENTIEINTSSGDVKFIKN